MSHFQIRQCSAPGCRFRFPWTPHDPPSLNCPRCAAPVEVVHTAALGAEQPGLTAVYSKPDLAPIQGLLDNVRSAFNVGSIFRSADGVQMQHLYLCGITPTPHHAKVAKTALGAEQAIRWSYHSNALDLAYTLLASGCRLWALEESVQAKPLFATPNFQSDSPLVLIVGNEVTGVDPALLALCEQVVCIPMWGAKRSLNVAIAFGIAAYGLRCCAQPDEV